jgi:hypothetical protein
MQQKCLYLDAAELARVVELLDLLDGFLRSGNGISDRLADYLHATGRDRSHPQDCAGYDANVVIDLVSFTSYGLRHRREP